MQPQQLPTTYQGWLARLASCSSTEDIYQAAEEAARRSTNLPQTRADIATIIVEKYSQDLKRVGDNEMAIRTIKNKFNTIMTVLFKTPLEVVVKHVKVQD